MKSKTLVFLTGPNGVGKSTIAQYLNMKMINSAFLDSEWCRMTNPFELTENIATIVERNISAILRNYLESGCIDTVIFTYGFHGERSAIFKAVMKNIEDIEFRFIPIVLECTESENVRRMKVQGRRIERIDRALQNRQIYDRLTYTRIETTKKKVDDIAEEIIRIIK